MPLNLLKLTSSIYIHNHHHHHIWLRRPITIAKHKTPPSPTSGWWRITSFAPQSQLNNINNNNNNGNNELGFRGPKTLRYYCSVNMETVSSDNRNGKRITENDGHLKPPQQNPSAKLLTLPTILTIARVVSVPVLISSMFFYPAC